MLFRNAAAVVIASTISFSSSKAFAGRPFVIDDVPTVPANNLEVEFGVAGSRQSGDRELRWPVIDLAYGLSTDLEIGMSIQRLESDSRGEPPVKGFEDLHLTAKYRIAGEGEVLPALGLALDIKVSTANRKKNLSTGKSDQSFLFLTTKSLSPVLAHLNLGYSLVQSPRGEKLKNRIFGGLAGEWPFSPRWTLVGEVFGFSREASGDRNSAEFQLGLKYSFAPNLVLDAAAGRSLRSVGNSIRGTAGLTWLIDLSQVIKP